MWPDCEIAARTARALKRKTRTGERRWIALRMTQPAADAAIFVSGCARVPEDEHGEEIIRIISARDPPAFYSVQYTVLA